MKFIVDIESNGLLQTGINYLDLPYKLKSSYTIHCIVIQNIDLGTVATLVQKEITKENLKKSLKGCTELIGHNIVSFDLPVLYLYGVLDYRIGYPGEPCTLFEKEVKITDTLILSKLLNADRFGGHSLEAWGKRLGNYKGDFHDWENFSQEMLEYCIQDTAVNADIYKELLKEQGKHDWSIPYSAELKLADLALRRELLGFAFDKDLAESNVKDLSEKMQEIASKIDPLLPPKIINKTERAKYVMPKLKFKKNGEMSSSFSNFLERTGAVLIPDKSGIIYEDTVFDIDYEYPIKTTTKADIEDIDVVKSYLLSLGWEPTEIKERDITKNQNKTIKKVDEIKEAIERYINQTTESLYKDLRLNFLGLKDIEDLRAYLYKRLNDTKPQIKYGKMQAQKPIFLPTTPKLTVGVEKEICPNLVELGEKAAFVKDVVHYYTYRHRKNSIAGGVIDEDGDPETGFLSAVREDGRIPTPADTLGANTGRYKHKLVCNIPRVTSLFGENMRNMFGCGKGMYQLGFDFASLEARIMGSYVIPYTNGKELAEALVAEKPNDIHSINARKLGIDRNAAKSFSYAAIYGAQPKKLSKMLGISEHEGKRLFNEYWDAVPALKELKEDIEKQWEATRKKYIKGLDGRLLQTRSKHSLINVLFQSGGAISAKWSSIFLAKEAEKLGILGDPFKDTLQDKKVWFMIEYHDEVQFAVHPSLLKVKVFKSEEEAKIFSKENPLSSAVGHGSKGYYLGLKTEPVECIEKGIKKACKFLNLNVELGFEWIPGLTWGQCH